MADFEDWVLRFGFKRGRAMRDAARKPVPVPVRPEMEVLMDELMDEIVAAREVRMITEMPPDIAAAEPCSGWLDEPGVPLHGGPCGEPSVCVIRAGCVHEHVTERRACSGCAIDEQQAAGLLMCGRCSMTGPDPHDCLPLVVIAWDEEFRIPEPVTAVQQPGAGFQVIEPFGRGEVIKTGRDEDLYVSWSHIAEGPKWIGTRAQALAAGCGEDRLRRADATGSSFMPSAPGCWWNDSGLVAEQRGSLSRDKLAAYVTAYMDDRLTEAYSMLEPFEDEETSVA